MRWKAEAFYGKCHKIRKLVRILKQDGNRGKEMG